MKDAHAWPPHLDALVAAPDHHFLLFENESVRVLDTIIPPGQTTPVHTHCWPSVLYVRAWSDFIRRDAEGNVLADSRTTTPPATGSAFWTPALPPHTLENIGDSEVHVVNFELKDRQ
jgi:hypothetical protein